MGWRKPHPPPRHDQKTFKKASYSQPLGENQKGFLAERQKVQPFLKTGSLTENSPIPKISWGVFDTARAFGFLMFRHWKDDFVVIYIICSLTSKFLKKGPPKKKLSKKITLRPHPRSLSPACWRPKASTEFTGNFAERLPTKTHESTFIRKNPNESETTGPQTISWNTHKKEKEKTHPLQSSNQLRSSLPLPFPFAPFANDFELPRHPVEEASIVLLTVLQFYPRHEKVGSSQQLEMDSSTTPWKLAGLNSRHWTPKKLHKFPMNWIWHFFWGGWKVFWVGTFTSRFILVESHAVFCSLLHLEESWKRSMVNRQVASKLQNC